MRVVNATGRSGPAAHTTVELGRLGFIPVAPANGALRRTTVITYPAGDQQAAEALAADSPGAPPRAPEAPPGRHRRAQVRTGRR